MSVENKRLSAIILAGGYSSRMGRNKAELSFHGVSFLQHQVNKLRSLGVEELLIAGYPGAPDGCRYVPDVYPHRGPLSGIHAGLLAAKEPRALVLAVDTPLVPESLLEELIEAHKTGITIVSCGSEIEPLIGVYDRALYRDCERLLRTADSSLRRLFQRVGVTTVEYRGDPALLINCNTPEDYRKILIRTRGNSF